MAESLDAVFKKKIDPVTWIPSSRSFSAGSYVAGSHEFYLGYAVSRKILLTLDAGIIIRRKASRTRFRQC